MSSQAIKYFGAREIKKMTPDQETLFSYVLPKELPLLPYWTQPLEGFLTPSRGPSTCLVQCFWTNRLQRNKATIRFGGPDAVKSNSDCYFGFFENALVLVDGRCGAGTPPPPTPLRPLDIGDMYHNTE